MNIRFGLIGCGHIAQRHAKHISALEEATLTAVYDIDTEKSAALAAKYPSATMYDNLEDFLAADLEMVNICTPNGLHYEGALAALEAGKNVLIEKPMTLSKAHSEELIKVALDKNCLLYVVKQNRFNPPVQAVKQLLNAGKLGDIYAVQMNCFWNRNEQYYLNSDWKGTKALDGGTLFTQYSHFIDVVYYLFDDMDIISGITSNVNHGDLIEFEDTGNFLFQFKKSKALGTLSYTTSAYGQNMEGSITIFAENATIKIGGKYLNTIDYQVTDGFDIEGLPASNPANNYGFYQGSMSNHDKMLHNVVEALNGREKIMTNAYEGLKIVEIIENMYAKAQFLG